MPQLLLLLVGALAVGAIGFGIAALISGGDPGLAPVEPDGRAVPLPVNRPLAEPDVAALRFDTGLRGYRMDQVDAALRRAAYDLGYKEELIGVLEAEVSALRDGRLEDADALRRAREAALRAATPAESVGAEPGPEPVVWPVAGPDAQDDDEPADASSGSGGEQAATASAPGGERVAPERVAPERVAPERVAPERVAPGPDADLAEGDKVDGEAAPDWSAEVDDSWRRQETKLG